VLVAPVGIDGRQSLLQLHRRTDGTLERNALAAVTFVPLLAGVVE